MTVYSLINTVIGRLYVHEFEYIKSASKLGENLKEAREKADFTQGEVGKIIGIERGGISYYENGKSIPSVFTLIKLAELYKTDVQILISVN